MDPLLSNVCNALQRHGMEITGRKLLRTGVSRLQLRAAHHRDRCIGGGILALSHAQHLACPERKG